MISRVLFVLLSLFGLQVYAQNLTENQQTYIDSLVTEVKEASERYDYKTTVVLCSALIEEGERLKSNYSKFFGYDLLGTVYTDLEDSAKARLNTQKALDVAKSIENDSLIAWGNLNMGNVYSDRPNDYHKAFKYFDNSLGYYEAKQDYISAYLVYINMAWTFVEHDRYDEAYDIIKKSEKLATNTEIPDYYLVYNTLFSGKYHYYKKNYKRAEKYFLKTVKIADGDSILDLADEAYGFLAKIYRDRGDYANALSSLEKEKIYQEKVYSTSKINTVDVAKARFELQQYQKDLELSLKEQEFSKEDERKSTLLTNIFITTISVLLLAVLGFFLLYKSKRKILKELSQNNKELVAAKDKAEKLSSIKTQFFSTVSHELRTPLYGVIGIASILQEDIKSKKHEQELKSLKFSADYLLSLINDVLLLNKMDYKDLVIEQIPFQLNTLIKSITRSFEFSLEQNNNKLHVFIEDNVPNNLIGSSVRISQILMNLIGNSVKFNENGNVWLNISLKQPRRANNTGLHNIHFSVKDDGIGIPEDKQADIFEEFSQVEDDNYNHRGTGLGLPIVKKLLKLHHSDIFLKSTLGEGSEFSFTLELLENKNADLFADNNNLSLEDMSRTLSSKHQNAHILVVDDNKINQKITQRILDRNDIKSSVANDGQEAIDMTKVNDYNLILMDINMPRVDGIEARFGHGCDIIKTL